MTLEKATMSTTPFDWLDYPQQLELLQRFRCPANRAEIESLQGLEAKLGESAKDAIDRFIQCGLVNTATLSGMLSMKFDIQQLKTICREHGLRYSGTRGILVERLVSEKPSEMQVFFRNEVWIECTGDGKAILDRWKTAAQAQLEKEIAGYRKSRIADMKNAGITMVKFLDSGRGDDCDVCQSLNGKIFSINSPPPLPPPGCTCKPKCRAVLVAHSSA